jgi:hypothetical protein
LFIGLALVRGLIYAAVIPPWQVPDETGHFEYAWLTAELGRVPTWDDTSSELERELLASLYEWRYGDLVQRRLPAHMPTRIADLPANVFARSARTVLTGRFSLAYVWQAVFLFSFLAQDLPLQLYAARTSSVLLQLGIVCLAYLTFRELFPRRHNLSELATAMIVLNPQHTFINSAVGDGPLAEAMATLVVYCWVRLFARRLSIPAALGVVLGTIVGILTKNTAAFLIPVDGVLAAWWLLRRNRHRWSRRHIAYLCIGVVVLGAGLWAWSQTELGRRSFSVIRILSSPIDWTLVDRRGTTVGEALLGTYDSFWGNYGWMILPLSDRWYGAITAISALSLGGWLIRGREKMPGWAVGTTLVTLSGALLVYLWAVILSRQGAYFQFQGRWLYPALVPLCLFLVEGMDRLFDVSSGRAAARLFLAFMLCLDTWSLCGYVLPYFYG